MKPFYRFRGVFILGAIALSLLNGCSREEKIAPRKNGGLTNSSSTNAAVLSPEKNDSASTNSAEHRLPGISGKITLKGTPPPERVISMDATCGAMHSEEQKTRFYSVDDGGLADVFVYIKEGLSGQNFPAAENPVLLNQSGCEYVPYVVGLQTGQTLLVRNSDPVLHNVHALPKADGNKELNKAQMAKSPDLKFTFANPETFLTFKCDVHPWMFAYVCVADHPYFAVSEKDGTFTLKNVPAGKYLIEAIHRKAGKQAKEITIADGEAKSLDFTLEVPGS